MPEELKLLEMRVIVLEHLVELLLGKAIADSGHMEIALDELVDESTIVPADADPFTTALLRQMSQSLSERAREGQRRSLVFPRQWKRRPRRG